MRAVNVLLSVLVCVVVAALAVEGGLRLLGLGPQPTIHEFDGTLGWRKKPFAESRRKSGEFDVRFAINELGLRDDPMKDPGKPQGTYRVVFLGDSFVLGYTVDRENLFVDQLEDLWQAEGRRVDVINAGTEGWSTDQEVLWYMTQGRNFAADLVVLCPYENDLYWNGQTSYLRYPKPRFNADGKLERRTLLNPGPIPQTDQWATTRLWKLVSSPPPRWEHAGRTGLEMEWGAYFHEPPAFMGEAYLRTRGALLALKNFVADTGGYLRVAPIPSKASIEPAARAALARRVRVDPAAWSADEPVDTFLELCRELSIPALDARDALRREAADGASLYFEKDWHFNEAGNRAFAGFLHEALDREDVFPAAFAAVRPAELPPPVRPGGLPGWAKLYLGLLAALSVLYALTYRDEPLWVAPLKVGALLGLVFAIAIGGGRLLALVPAPWSNALLFMFVGGLVMFILYKLGRRLGTIAELFLAFTRRGHWYLMPLVIVLLTIGSLLVVAASSPLIAPFIYTLF